MSDFIKYASEKVECIHCKNLIPSGVETCPFCMTPNKRKYSDYTVLAQRIVGIILIINGIGLAIEEILFKAEGQQFGNPVSAIISSIVIGILILTGNEKGIKWGKIAVCIGAVLYPIVYITQGDIFLVVVQLVYSFILISLLFWNPGKIRIIVSTSLAILYFMLEGIGIQVEITGESALANWLIGNNFDMEELTDTQVNGRHYNYKLELPVIGNWSALSEQEIARNSADADIWLMNSSPEAHIIVVAESLKTDLDSFRDLVQKNLKLSFPQSQLKASIPVIAKSGLSGKQFDMLTNIDGISIKYRYGLFISEECAFQIICFSAEKTFTNVETEFNKIIKSFSLTSF